MAVESSWGEKENTDTSKMFFKFEIKIKSVFCNSVLLKSLYVIFITLRT